jgi:Phage integrase family
LPNDDDFAADEWEDPKSDAGGRTISLDTGTVAVLRTWRAQQNAEKLAHGPRWTESGRVFTHDDGTRLNPDGVSQRFDRLITRFNTIRAEHTDRDWTVQHLATRHRMPTDAITTALTFGPLPPIRLHDLRHTAASLTYRATRDLKLVSELLGHASIQFTSDVYTTIFTKSTAPPPKPSPPSSPAPTAPPPRRSNQKTRTPAPVRSSTSACNYSHGALAAGTGWSAAKSPAGVARLNVEEPREPIRGPQIPDALLAIQRVFWILDSVHLAVIEHQNIVILKENARAHIPVVVVFVLRQSVVAFISFAVLDRQVKHELLRVTSRMGHSPLSRSSTSSKASSARTDQGRAERGRGPRRQPPAVTSFIHGEQGRKIRWDRIRVNTLVHDPPTSPVEAAVPHPRRKSLSVTEHGAHENSCGHNGHTLATHAATTDLQSRSRSTSMQVKRGRAGGTRTHDPRIMRTFPVCAVLTSENPAHTRALCAEYSAVSALLR